MGHHLVVEVDGLVGEGVEGTVGDGPDSVFEHHAHSLVGVIAEGDLVAVDADLALAVGVPHLGLLGEFCTRGADNGAGVGGEGNDPLLVGLHGQAVVFGVHPFAQQLAGELVVSLVVILAARGQDGGCKGQNHEYLFHPVLSNLLIIFILYGNIAYP